MNTDRELLELAAKAAGIEVWFPRMNGGKNPDGTRLILTPCHTEQNGFVEEWNPLTDDADALRLAVRLQFDVCQQIQTNDPVTPAGCVVVAPGGHTCFEPNNADTYAATRRAIVRAAAAIGKGMK